MTRKALSETLVKKAPKSTENLLDLLFQGLDWPRPAALDIEDIPLIDWSPEELHLDAKAVAKLSQIQQLPTLKEGQPFGVFILTFEGGKFPVGAVRRVVKQLVRGKRRKDTPKSLWNLSDLIFFCKSKDGGGTLHIVSFKDTKTVPVLRVISWASNATPLEVEAIANGSLADLRWPGHAIEVDTWRELWSNAFSSGLRQEVKDSDQLAQLMAQVAIRIRDEVRETYEVESESGVFRSLHHAMKETIRANLSETEFADMFAQTMVYGLLGARIAYPEEFSADSLSSTFKFENPFLDSLYSQFRRDSDDHVELDEFGLLDLVEMLREIDIESVLRKFSAENRKDDPVVYFYEHFIDNYDPDLRRKLGIYYTPIEVVRFMVKAVDDLIVSNWGLKEGLVDTTTWGELSAASGCPIPSEATADQRVVSMIDPATGTGTFLLEWIRRCIERAGNRRDVLLGAMDGTSALEIELSSYAVAHMKTALSLPKDVRGETLPNICLGDTLAPKHFGLKARLEGDDPIAKEGIRTEELKFATKHTVVIGNPPYLRDQEEPGADGFRLGGMVRYQEDSDELGLMEDLVTYLSDTNAGVHAKNLYNLFVYFWRWALWKTVDSDSSSPAVISFITPSSWLSGPAYAGLRKRVRQDFDEVRVVDLGGDGLGARKESNIFGIQIPVSIVVASRGAKSSSNGPRSCRVLYRKIPGSVDDKLAGLADIEVWPGDGFANVLGAEGDIFLPGSADGQWELLPLLTDLFPWQHSGAQYTRTWPIATSRRILESRWARLASAPKAERRRLFRESRDRKIDTKIRSIYSNETLPEISKLGEGEKNPFVRRYGFRSFDRQWALADPRVGDFIRPILWQIGFDGQIFLVSLLTGVMTQGPALMTSSHVPDYHHFCGRGGKHIIPMYRDRDRTPNFSPAALEVLRGILGEDVNFEDVVRYSVGLLGGSNFTERFYEELAVPGVRLPITRSRELFDAVATFGDEVLRLQTFGESSLNSSVVSSIASSCEWVKTPTRRPSTLKELVFDPEKRELHVADGLLSGVSKGAFNFKVSGYEVIRRWVSFRCSEVGGRGGRNEDSLDQVSASSWLKEWSVELCDVVNSLNGLVRLGSEGDALLDLVLRSYLIQASEIPQPEAFLRKPPREIDASGLFD
jgi:hypothetical protein